MTTLTTLVEDLRRKLADVDVTDFTPSALEQAIRDALREINQVSSAEVVGTVTLSASSREISIAGLIQPAMPYEVWLPYDASDPSPRKRRFTWLQGANSIYITDNPAPTSGQVARVFYRTDYRIEGLDGATSTTLPDLAIGPLLAGAAAEAVNSRRVQIMETTPANLDALKRYEQLYKDWRSRFGAFLLNRRKAAAGEFISWR